MDPRTLAIHSLAADDQFHSVNPPIYQTSTYWQEYPGKDAGYCYTRTGNPTRDQVQRALADLEGGKEAYVFATGICAENTLLQAFLKPGDTVVVPGDLYGGTHRLLFQVFPRWGIKTVRADYTNVEAVARASKGAAIVWAESPTNPRLECYDLPAIIKAVKKQGNPLCVVDNTFATPMGSQPLSYGADIVMQSVTKYLAGHSDVVIDRKSVV